MPAVTVNVAEVEPAGTVTLEGTLAAVLELESETDTPPVPAAAVRLTVPVPVCPLVIALGLTETPLNFAAGGLMVTPKLVLTPEYEAVKVAPIEELTVPAVTVNVAEVEPAGTVTLDGTPTAVVLELASETTTPPVRAAAVRVTVPVPIWPLTIVLGLTEALLNAADIGLTEKANEAFTLE